MSTTYTPRTLLANSEYPCISKRGTILSGRSLAIGVVLAAVTCGAITASAISGTGNATIGTLSRGAGCQPGVYRVQMISATKFNVYDPSGQLVGQGTHGTAFANQVGFTITSGGTACVAGDYFLLTVAAGSGKLKAVDSTATDGSDKPVGVLTEDIDAGASDMACVYYETGQFNVNALSFGGTDTIDNHRAALRALGIWAVEVTS